MHIHNHIDNYKVSWYPTIVAMTTVATRNNFDFCHKKSCKHMGENDVNLIKHVEIGQKFHVKAWNFLLEIDF